MDIKHYNNSTILASSACSHSMCQSVSGCICQKNYVIPDSRMTTCPILLLDLSVWFPKTVTWTSWPTGMSHTLTFWINGLWFLFSAFTCPHNNKAYKMNESFTLSSDHVESVSPSMILSPSNVFVQNLWLGACSPEHRPRNWFLGSSEQAFHGCGG